MNEIELLYPQGQWLRVKILYTDDEITLVKRTTGRGQKHRILKNEKGHQFKAGGEIWTTAKKTSA